MSSYMHFFIRKGNEFAPIATYGRSSCTYQAFKEFAPYEKIRPLTALQLGQVDEKLRADLESQYNRDAIVERINMISKFNNSVDEKLAAIEDEVSALKELEDEEKALKRARKFVSFLLDIIDEAHSSQYYEDAAAHIDPNAYIYVGIECGGVVNVDTIEK